MNQRVENSGREEKQFTTPAQTKVRKREQENKRKIKMRWKNHMKRSAQVTTTEKMT